MPVGGAGLICFIFVKLPPQQKKDWTTRSLFWDLDIPGFFIFAPATIMLLLALGWGGSSYPWNSATVIGLLCGAAIAYIIFIFWEARAGPRAMIPGTIMILRPVWSSTVGAFFNGGAMLVLTYYLVLWFQVTKGASPTDSGVYMLPNILAQVVLAVVSGFGGKACTPQPTLLCH